MQGDGRGKCFVISEISVPGSIARARADRFLLIIRKAFEIVSERLGRQIVAERLDADRSVDNFMREVVRRILRYEFVIAVLSNRNPNAHLELGIALAAGRRCIVLVEGEEEMPSDLSGDKYVQCDLFDIEHSIVRLAEEVLARLEQPEPLVAFGRYSALGKPDHAVRYLNRFKDLTWDDWSDFLWNARDFLTVASTSFNMFADPKRRFFKPRAKLGEPREKRYNLLEILLLRAAAEGVQVKVLVMDPENPFLPHLIHARTQGEWSEKVADTKKEIRTNLGLIVKALSRGAASPEALGRFLTEEYPGRTFDDLKTVGLFELTTIKVGPLFSRLCVSENGAIVSPYYLNEATNSDGPSFFLTNTSIFGTNDVPVTNNFYDKVIDELNEIRAINSEPAVRLSSAQCRQILSAS